MSSLRMFLVPAATVVAPFLMAEGNGTLIIYFPFYAPHTLLELLLFFPFALPIALFGF